MKKNYKITVVDTATYIIRAEMQKLAEEHAVELFDEREPTILTEETEEEYDCEI